MSDRLVEPYWVQYNSSVQGEEGTNLAFPFLVVHEHEEEHVDGWVLCNDDRNTAGLSQGLNWRSDVGRMEPGNDGSWCHVKTGDE